MLALPLASAVAAMFKTSVNIPLNDDYDGILSYLDHFVHTSGYFARLGWLLTAEHAKYKLILLNTVVTLQYVVLGHLNFRALELLGDLSVPAIIWTLWLLLARQRRPLSQAVWLILVPWYLFLSLCYWETVNWTTGEFQALAVIPLSIGCVLFFTSSIRHAEIWGTLFLILSIAANGSGFFLAAALLAVLIYNRRVRAAVLVILAGCIMAAIYCVHYAGMSDPRPPPHLGVLLAFPFAFLGSIVSTFPWCIAFGVILVATFVALLTRGWARVSPETFCIGLFCILTAAAIGPARYHEGLESAISSRYRMYSLLLLCVEYLAALQIFTPHRLRLRSAFSAAIGLGAALSISFAVRSQMSAYRELHARQRILTAHLILWERHPERVVAVPEEYLPSKHWEGVRVIFQNTLQHAIAEDLYRPSVSAWQQLPVKPHSPSTIGIEDEPTPTR
ncbi:MAG TPA: hypothetical protein VFW30_12345 [Bryocella sp.]|nr:hypothetical protein [Bryocella sp.]